MVTMGVAEHAVCASMDWQRVPLPFHNGDYADGTCQYQNGLSSG